MTDRYAVIGNPIAHSKSPQIHAAFAAQTGQDIEYTTIAGRPGQFARDVDALRAAGGRGLNVTAPFKLDACAYADVLDPGAVQAGAVNCLAFEGGRAAGYNFDGVGLARDIAVNLGVALRGARILLLGAGGAARGALPALLQHAPAEVAILNRTEAAAIRLAGRYAGQPVTAAAPDARGFDVVVNATSASLAGALPAMGGAAFARGCLAYEMVYGAGLTPFLRLARESGAGRLADGVGMLVEQAAEAFVVWRGVRPDTAPVIRALTVPLT